MAEPSVHALICDLLGEEPEAARRPTVGQALARCAPGQVMAARRGAREVAAVVTADGRAYVVPDRCPHEGVPLSGGFVDGRRLVCPRHGWEFDLDTGQCPGHPGVRLEVARLPPRPLRRA